LILVLVLASIAGCTGIKHPDTIRSAKRGVKPIELSLEMPNEDYAVGKRYIATVTLKSDIQRPILCEDGDREDLFEITAHDAFEKAIGVEMLDVEATTTPGSRLLVDHVTKSMRFTQAGNYKIRCRLKGAVLPVKGWPNQSIDIETDPIVIKVR
jgi:hypothetical protein